MRLCRLPCGKPVAFRKVITKRGYASEAQPRHKSNAAERHSLSARNAAEPQEVSLREGTFGFGMLAIELWTLDYLVNRKVLRFRVMHDDCGSRLLGIELKLFS